MLDFRTIKTERQFKDATGYSKFTFESLLLNFKKVYKQEYGMNYEKYIEENVTEEVKLKTLDDILFLNGTMVEIHF